MRGVGVPGGPRQGGSGGRSSGNKMKQAEYRHSEAGKLARKMRNMMPERRAIMAVKRAVKRHVKGGF